MTEYPPPPPGNVPPPPPGNYPPPPPGNYPPPPGGYSQGGYPPPSGPPDNNLVWGILVLLFCCLPFGIVSIVKSTQVSGLWAQGQYQAAQAAAADAKKWALWGAIAGAALVVLYLIIVFGFGVALFSTTVPSTTPTYSG